MVRPSYESFDVEVDHLELAVGRRFVKVSVRTEPGIIDQEIDVKTVPCKVRIDMVESDGRRNVERHGNGRGSEPVGKIEKFLFRSCDENRRHAEAGQGFCKRTSNAA